MLLLLLLQILLLDKIHLLGYATPIIIVYMTMSMQRGTSRIALILWGFSIGLVHDIFSNTIGLGMASSTLLAMLQPTLLTLFAPSEASDDLVPTAQAMGWRQYILYAAATMLIYHITFYALDAFSLADISLTFSSAALATVAATVIVLCIQLVRSIREQQHS